MNFLIIRPATREVVPIEAKELHDVYDAAGLAHMEVDHGLVRRAHDDKPGVGVVVFEWGFRVEAAKQHYFAIYSKLYAGTAVAYGFDEAGETIDLPFDAMPEVDWFADHHAVEAAIRDGALKRPQLRVDGRLLWQWPEPFTQGENENAES
jgi:hypothetical protein